MGPCLATGPSLCELPNRHAPDFARPIPVAGGPLEHDPVGIDAPCRLCADHQNSAGLDPDRTVVRMDSEQLRGGPTQPVRLLAVLIAKGEGAFSDRGPFRRGQVPAGRGVRGQVLNFAPPTGDDRVKRGGGGAGRHAAELPDPRQGSYAGSSIPAFPGRSISSRCPTSTSTLR